jgi:hypothetical protein
MLFATVMGPAPLFALSVIVAGAAPTNAVANPPAEVLTFASPNCMLLAAVIVTVPAIPAELPVEEEM